MRTAVLRRHKFLRLLTQGAVCHRLQAAMAEILTRSEKVNAAQEVKGQVRSFLGFAQSGDVQALKAFVDNYVRDHSEPGHLIRHEDVSADMNARSLCNIVELHET
jgi:hypothetical protein